MIQVFYTQAQPFYYDSKIIYVQRLSRRCDSSRSKEIAPVPISIIDPLLCSQHRNTQVLLYRRANFSGNVGVKIKLGIGLIFNTHLYTVFPNHRQISLSIRYIRIKLYLSQVSVPVWFKSLHSPVYSYWIQAQVFSVTLNNPPKTKENNIT